MLLRFAVVHLPELRGVLHAAWLAPFGWAVVFMLSGLAFAVPYLNNAYEGFRKKPAPGRAPQAARSG